MPRRITLARFFRTRLVSNSKSVTRRKPILLLSIAALAVTAVVFSISVESRSGGWLRKAFGPEAKSPVAAAQNSGDRSQNNVATPSAAANPYFTLSPNSPLAPIVTATKTDALQIDLDMDGKADPGDTLRYSVVIGATGEDATGVQFSDTVDPNTAFVPGSIMTTPLARNDSYAASGNIRIQVPAPGVLATSRSESFLRGLLGVGLGNPGSFRSPPAPRSHA